ncbi:MAG: class I SAM-dependent methyltransferase [Microgenomates group bacterium]
MTDDVRGFQDTIDWYDSSSEKYAENIESIPSISLIDKFVEVVSKGETVLDAGCAAGRDCRLLKDRGLKPVGLDLSKGLLEVARKKHPDIKFQYGNMLELPFENGSFGGVWAHASLLHFEKTKDVASALSEFNRVLKRDGVLHILVKEQKVPEKTSVVSDKVSGHKRFFQWFTRKEIETLLKNAGFSIIEIQDGYKDPAGRKEISWIYSLSKKL